MAKINVLSPYFINVKDPDLVSVQLEIEIYHGVANTSWQSSPQYTLQSTAIDTSVTFEVSELIKDYIKAEFNGDYPMSNTSTDEATTRYVDYRITETHTGGVQTPVDNLANRAYYGYGYFEDGANPQFTQGYLQSNNKVLKPDDSPLRIAVDPINTTSVAFFSNGQQTYSWLPSGTYKIQDQVLYISNLIGGGDSFENRVVQDGGTYEDNVCIQDFLDDYIIYPVDTVYVSGAEGVTIINVDNIQECKYPLYKLTFINKFGAIQDLYFNKKRTDILNVKRDDYNTSTISSSSSGVSYNTYDATNIVQDVASQYIV